MCKRTTAAIYTRLVIKTAIGPTFNPGASSAYMRTENELALPPAAARPASEDARLAPLDAPVALLFSQTMRCRFLPTVS